MFTRVPWEVTGGYLEGNYNMGGKRPETFVSDNTISLREGLDHNLGEPGLGGALTAGATRINEGISHNVEQLGKGLHTLIHGEGDKGGDDDTSVTQRDTSAFAQSKKPRKKRKGLLALQTPSAKASRFRAGKRRFRVRPTGKTGVNTGAKSSGVSVPKG